MTVDDTAFEHFCLLCQPWHCYSSSVPPACTERRWMGCRQGLLVWASRCICPCFFAGAALHDFFFHRVILVAVTCQRLIMMRGRKNKPQTSWASLQHIPQVRGHQRRREWLVCVTSIWRSTFMSPFPPHRQLIKAESIEEWSAMESVSSQSVLWVWLWSVETKGLTVWRLFSSWVLVTWKHSL